MNNYSNKTRYFFLEEIESSSPVAHETVPCLTRHTHGPGHIAMATPTITESADNQKERKTRNKGKHGSIDDARFRLLSTSHGLVVDQQAADHQ